MIKIENVYYSHSRRWVNFNKNKDLIYQFEDLSVEIKKGDRVALLGFNGAGKSTLIKIILGIIHPQKGSVTVDNLNIHKNRIKLMKEIGVVWGQRSTLWWDIPVVESYNTLRKIYKISENDFNERLEFFDNAFKLKEYWNLPVRQLSLGQRVKAEIVASLLHNPKILVYDEPFNGLDFITKKKVLEVLRKIMSEEEKTFILTSHDMYDIENLCEDIVVLGNKKVLKRGSVSQLREANSKSKYVIIELAEDFDFESSQFFKENVSITKLEYNKYEITFNTCEVEENKLLEDIIKNNKIKDIQINKQSLKSTIEKFLEND